MQGCLRALALLAMGVLVGALATSHVWITTAQVMVESSRVDFLTEQEFLADRAIRSDDDFRSVVHSLNAADAEAELGFRWLQRTRHRPYWSWLTQPWRDFVSAREILGLVGDPRIDTGRRRLEGRARARAALALERIGSADLAEIEWAQATALEPSWSVEKYREFVSLQVGDPGLESAYLDSRTYEELFHALALLRGDAHLDSSE